MPTKRAEVFCSTECICQRLSLHYRQDLAAVTLHVLRPVEMITVVAYYYLGRYRCDAVQLFRSLDTYGNAVDLVAEIKPPDRSADSNVQAAAPETVD
jgi:hypothetical protein